MTENTASTDVRPTAPTRDEVWRRGLARPDPRRIGVLIGTIGGIVFVLSSAFVLPAPWNLVASAVAVAIALAIVWRLFIGVRPLGAPERPHRFAWPIYGASVIAMLVVIALGRLVLNAQGLELAAHSLIAFAVGAHFVPFAVAFHERLFVRLGLAVAAVGLVGLLLGVLVDERWGAAGAIAAGFVQLAMLLEYTYRRRDA